MLWYVVLGCAIICHVVVCYMLCNHVMLPFFNSYVILGQYHILLPIMFLILNLM